MKNRYIVVMNDELVSAHKALIIEQADAVAVATAYTYSLQTEYIAKYVQQNDILVLWSIGIRYDDVREFIQQHQLRVYRVDSLDDVIRIIHMLENDKDAAVFAANLNER